MDQNWLNSELNQELLDPARDSTPAFRTWEFSHFAFLSIQRDTTCNKNLNVCHFPAKNTETTSDGARRKTLHTCRLSSVWSGTIGIHSHVNWLCVNHRCSPAVMENRKHLSGRANFGPLLSAILWRTLKFRTPACRYFPIRPSLRARLK